MLLKHNSVTHIEFFFSTGVGLKIGMESIDRERERERFDPSRIYYPYGTWFLIF